MYGWLEETGQRADNPTRFLKAPKSERKLPTLITEAQIDALLAAPDVENAARTARQSLARSHVCNRFARDRSRQIDAQAISIYIAAVSVP